VISRNIQMDNYLNNLNFFENSNLTNTFLSNISNIPLNRTALLPSTETIQQKMNNYLNNIENDRNRNFISNKKNKIIELEQKNSNDLNPNSNNYMSKNNKLLISNNKKGKNLISQKFNKKNKSPENNAINLKKNKTNMITLSFKYNKNVNTYIYKKIKEISKHRNYADWTKQLIQKMTKTKTKTKTKSKSKSKTKSKSNSKNKKRMIYRNKNLLSNQFKKFNEKSMSHTNNIFNNKKLICQNYTTKIINNYMRENKFLNSTNLKNKRKAHSTSISKNEKYNLNSLIHNDNIYNMINEKKNK
jgi:hypothetical protein